MMLQIWFDSRRTPGRAIHLPVLFCYVFDLCDSGARAIVYAMLQVVASQSSTSIDSRCFVTVGCVAIQGQSISQLVY